MADIKTIDGISANIAWTEEVDADFTSLSTQSFDHDDTFDLGGATWLVQESDGSTTRGTIAAVAGSGIKLTPGPADTNIYTGVDVPLVSTKLADVCSSLSDDDIICVQFFIDEAVAIAANYDGYGGLIYEPGGPEGNLEDVTSWLQYSNFYYSAYSGRAVKVGSASYTESIKAAATSYTPTIFEMVYSFWSNYGISAASTSTSTDPAPFEANLDPAECLTATLNVPGPGGTFSTPTRVISASKARCGFGSFKVTSPTSFYVFLKRIRILRAGGSGGGLG